MPKILSDIQLWEPDRSVQIPLPAGETVKGSLIGFPKVMRRLGGVDEMTLMVKSGCPLAIATKADAYELSQGKIIRFVYDNSSIQEWRIKTGTREFSGQDDVKVTAEPIEQDLKDITIRKTLANGQTRASVSFYNQTFQDIATNLLSSEYNCPDLFTIGTVAAGLNDTTYNVVLNAAYVIEGLKKLCQLAEAEWGISCNATNDNYEINFYEAGQLGNAYDENLVSLWHCDGDVTDSAGDNDGTMHGDPQFVQGISGQALDFDGSNNVRATIDEITFSDSVDFSVSVWIKVTGVPGAGNVEGIIGRNFNDRWGIDHYFDGNQLRFGVRGSSQNIVTAPFSSTDYNKWHHAVLVHTSTGTGTGNITAYLNGVSAGNTSYSDTWETGAGLSIASNNAALGGTPKNFIGIIDEPRIYNRALTADEVKALYENPDGNTRTISMGGGKGNRLTLEKRDESEEFFSRVVPLMGEGSEIQTVAGARWRVDSYSSPTITLKENAIIKDGYGLIDGQTIYFGNEAEGWHEVTATTAPNKVTVSGDASGLTHGYFREGANKNEIVFLEDAEALAQVGLKEEKFQRPDIPPYSNLIEDVGISPAISDWSGGLPVGFQKIDGSETVSQATADIFVKHGTRSAKVGCDQHQGLQTDAIILEPEDLNPYFSSTLYLQVETGSVRVEIIDSAGKKHPKDKLAETDVKETRAIKIRNMEPAAGPAHIKIIAQSDNTVFYLDAITLTQSSYPFEYAPLMGPKALWIEAGKYLKKYGGDRPDVWSGEVMDEAYFGMAKEIEIGSFVKVQEDWNEDTGSYDTEFTVRVVEVSYQEDRVNGRYKKSVRLADKSSEAARIFQEQYLTVGSQQSSLQVREVPEKPIIDIDNAVVEGGTPRFEQVEIYPSTAKPPLVLGSNAQGELVTGFNADQLDGFDASDFLKAQNNLSDLSSITVAQDNLGLTDGSADLDFNSLGINGNGFVDSLRNITAATLILSDTLTGVDAVFSNNVSAAQATSTDHLVRADRTLQFTTDNALAFDIETVQNLTSNRSWNLSIADHGAGQRGVIKPTTQTIYGKKIFSDYTVFSGDLSSPGAISRVSGWQGDNQGNWDFRSIFSDSLVVKAFTADVAQAFRGSRFLTKSFATIDVDFVIPAVSNSATLAVREINGFAGLEVFEQNDYILMNIINQSGGGLIVGEAWGEITSSITDNGDGTQSFTLTVRHLSVPALAGLSANEGSEALSFGSASDPKGFIHDTVLDNLGSPYSQVVTWTNNPWDRTNWTVRTRTGNLEGVANANGYGFYGNRTYLTDYLLAGDLTKQGHYLEYDSGVLEVSGVINVIGGNAATQAYANAQASAAQTAAENYTDSKVYRYPSNAYAPTDDYGLYSPQPAIAVMRVSSDATWPAAYGIVMTYNQGTGRVRQVFYAELTSSAWERSWAGVWSSWRETEDVAGAQLKADQASATARDNLAYRLGYSNYSEMVSGARANSTLIDGGFINTTLIHADQVIANAASIGGWNLTTNKLYSGGITLDSSVSAIRVFAGSSNEAGISEAPSSNDVMLWAGASYANRANGKFSVTRFGSLHAETGDIAGWNLTADSLYKIQDGLEISMGNAVSYSTSYFGFSVGTDGSNRIYMAKVGTSGYQLRGVVGGQTLFSLGTGLNRIAGSYFDSTAIWMGSSSKANAKLTLSSADGLSFRAGSGPSSGGINELEWYAGPNLTGHIYSYHNSTPNPSENYLVLRSPTNGGAHPSTIHLTASKVQANANMEVNGFISQWKQTKFESNSGERIISVTAPIVLLSASSAPRISRIDLSSSIQVAGKVIHVTFFNTGSSAWFFKDKNTASTAGSNIRCNNQDYEVSPGTKKTISLDVDSGDWYVEVDHGA